MPFGLLRAGGLDHHRAMDTSPARSQRIYDHRLRDLVQSVGDPHVVADLGVARSTVQGWLRGEHRPVVSADVLDMEAVRLQAEVLKLRRRVRMLGAIVGLPWLSFEPSMFASSSSAYPRVPRRPDSSGPSNEPRALSHSGPLCASWAFRHRATIGGVGPIASVSSMASPAARGRRPRGSRLWVPNTHAALGR